MSERRPGFWYRSTWVLDGDALVESMPSADRGLLRLTTDDMIEYRLWTMLVDALDRPTQRPLLLPRSTS